LLNGNIQAMTVAIGQTGFGLMGYNFQYDQLNRLKTMNVNKGLTAATQYTYDSNGNLTSDINKGITNITYNHLNLPLTITFVTNRIEFIYDATGVKLRKTLFVNNIATDTTSYINGIEYKGLILNRFPHTEGAVVRQTDGTFLHEYTIKDHLGNSRVTYVDKNADGKVDSSEIKQVNSYYPFGLNMAGNFNGANGINKYQYNGKELNQDFGLDWNDYGARFSDAVIGRWMQVDPEGESNGQISFSNYHYTFDNPIRFNDPDGKEGEACCGRMLASLVGTAVSVVDNLSGSNLRDLAGSDFSGSMKAAFNEGVAIGDKGSLVIGGILMGGGAALATGGGALSLTGVGAPVGVPAAAVGGTAVVVGGLLAGHALNNLQNSKVEAKQTSNSSNNETPQAKTKNRTATEHTSNATPSNKGVHEKGMARKQKDQAAGDARYAKTKSTKTSQQSKNEKKNNDPSYKRTGPKEINP
jgi:RHS repeat-associated protein